eukprot:m.76337 g.76337  ORF g.76337 m.76337 type:complete len:390 (-) comp14631_c0_seq1:230-1399(-)
MDAWLFCCDCKNTNRVCFLKGECELQADLLRERRSERRGSKETLRIEKSTTTRRQRQIIHPPIQPPTYTISGRAGARVVLLLHKCGHCAPGCGRGRVHERACHQLDRRHRALGLRRQPRLPATALALLRGVVVGVLGAGLGVVVVAGVVALRHRVAAGGGVGRRGRLVRQEPGQLLAEGVVGQLAAGDVGRAVGHIGGVVGPEGGARLGLGRGEGRKAAALCLRGGGQEVKGAEAGHVRADHSKPCQAVLHPERRVQRSHVAPERHVEDGVARAAASLRRAEDAAARVEADQVADNVAEEAARHRLLRVERLCRVKRARARNLGDHVPAEDRVVHIGQVQAQAVRLRAHVEGAKAKRIRQVGRGCQHAIGRQRAVASHAVGHIQVRIER